MDAYSIMVVEQVLLYRQAQHFWKLKSSTTVHKTCGLAQKCRKIVILAMEMDRNHPQKNPFIK